MTSTERDPRRSVEAIAGLLGAAALFLGFLGLAYRPFRLAPVALVLALVATLMSREHQRLIAMAMAVIGVCFVVGAALQVIVRHPLF